jgi:hypothetical protein
MNMADAIIHCLRNMKDDFYDRMWHSELVRDCNGGKHWISLLNGVPKLQSECPTPFSEKLEPYTREEDHDYSSKRD